VGVVAGDGRRSFSRHPEDLTGICGGVAAVLLAGSREAGNNLQSQFSLVEMELMICHQYKCVFVHIPKTGGQSIEHVFLNLVGLTWKTRAPLLLRSNHRPEVGPPRLAHLLARDYVRYKYLTQQQFDEYYKFAFVRNPWDRAVSLYKFLGYHQRYTFKTFLQRKLKDQLWRKKYWFVAPQSEFVCNEKGEILVDFVARFENFQADFNQVCQRIGLPPTEVPHVNKSSSKPKHLIQYAWRLFQKASSPGSKNYQDYYDPEAKELVARLYRSDIELFGYQFAPEVLKLETILGRSFPSWK
jgi:hypothetical protein